METEPTPTEQAARWRSERAAVLRRRREAGLKRAPEAVRRDYGERLNDPVRELPTVGLALSGGGIRSATYGLGVLRGLAQRGLLPRLDYLSTVSGGGYIGAMFGRLVIELGIGPAQAMLAAGRSPLLDWLRRNGRYLTPAGARDAGIAAVTYLRAFVAMHAELMLAGVLFGLIVTGPHLWQHSNQVLDANAWEPWGTLWWPLAAAWCAAALPGAMCGYWLARDGPARRAFGLSLRDMAFTALLGGGAVVLTWLAWRLNMLRPLPGGLNAAPFGVLALWSLVLGLATTLIVLAYSRQGRSLAVARLRQQYTRGLALALALAAALALMGGLDVLSWWLLELALSDHDWLWGGVGLGGAAVLVLRALIMPLQQLMNQPGHSLKAWGPRLLNLAGLFALLLVGCFWLSLVQWLVFTSAPVEALQRVPAAWRALALLALCGTWWALTSANEGMANASSLHSFYRARLTRAYLSVGNRLRPVLRPEAEVGPAANVTQVVPHDDTDLHEYRPERHGGPLHLINTCLNQTRDDSSGLFNADRKGTLLTVLPEGVEIGPRGWMGFAADAEVGTLGKWIAVSGAAASPGAGSYTSRGWALVLFLLGVRLGLWVREPAPPARPRGSIVTGAWELFVKPLMLWAEATAKFVGPARPWWYLSDGGHFENTGVYALLKREVDFIVLADCSADARYEFNDIENLVRKARIDLGAEIEFYPHDEAERRFALAGGAATVLSPEDMLDNQSGRGMLLARIRYARTQATGPEHHGTLLVIKPNLHAALDVDLLAYAQRHPAFPHESTGDQFFDEAQWESYHRLGEDAGGALHEAWLAKLPGWHRQVTLDLSTPARLRQAKLPEGTAKEPMWRRSAKNTAIGATIGIGASGTLLLSLWQVSDQLHQNETTQRNELRGLFTEVSKALSSVDASCPTKVPAHVSLQVSLLRDLAASPALLPIERASLQQLLERTREQCRRLQPSPECIDSAAESGAGLCNVVDKPVHSADALSYWHPFPSPPGRMFTTATAWSTLLALWNREAPTQTASAAGNGGEAGMVQPPEPPAVPVSDAPGDAAPPPAAALPSPGPAAAPAAAVAAAEPASPRPAPTSVAFACGSPGQPVRLYLQVYDEATRERAGELRQRLQEAGGPWLQVAAVENVNRTAELRQQRKPVPWPRTTFIVHRAADESCARGLAQLVRGAWPGSGRRDRVWVGELPKSLTSQGRVIELWLPSQPDSASAGGAGGAGSAGAADEGAAAGIACGHVPTRWLCGLLIAALPVLAGCGGGVYIGIGDDDDDDDFPPDVSLAVSPDAARIGEALRFVAAASDDFRIDRVEFYAVRDDGSSLLLGSDPVAPYQLDATLPATAFDRVQFFARAVDDVGQAAGSAPVTVFVLD